MPLQENRDELVALTDAIHRLSGELRRTIRTRNVAIRDSRLQGMEVEEICAVTGLLPIDVEELVAALTADTSR